MSGPVTHRWPEATADPSRGEDSLTQRWLVFGDTKVPYLYGVACADRLAEAILDRLGDLDAVLFVVDSRATEHTHAVVARLSQRVRVEVLVLESSERAKTLATVASILDTATAHGLTRRSVIVAMGGGTVGNLAGLAAALLFRGIRLVHLPTTPVAAFDSVISIKQGVNLNAGKNLCGTYFAPALIACDLTWLTTVPAADLRTGLAEMVKNVLVIAPELEAKLVGAFRMLQAAPSVALRDLLEIGIDAKAPWLADDPHERRAAVIFEYGHTAGHAIEFTSGGAISHGEAVAWGMLVAAEVARRRHGLPDHEVARHHRLVALLDLPDPAHRLAALDRQALRSVLEKDNKRGHAPCAADEVLMVLPGPAPAPSATTPPLVAVPTEAVLDAIDVVRSRGGM
jgi:3-dehydroquinate synthase/2-deoxy-scyllo-inosose synthase